MGLVSVIGESKIYQYRSIISIGHGKKIGAGICGIGKIVINGIGDRLSGSLESISVFKYRSNPYRSISNIDRIQWIILIAQHLIDSRSL